MTGPVILRECDGSEDAFTMNRPEPPESDVIVKRSHTMRVVYQFAGYEDGVPVYAVHR